MTKIQISLLFLLLLFSSHIQAQDLPTIPKNPNRPTVAVVLSGGGAKGFSHVGVLKVLEEEGIPIDLIVGTSIGSLVGGFYASGYDADSLLCLMRQQNWDSLLTDDVNRRYLSVPSKAIEQRYLISLPIKENKLIIPQGVMSGQNVVNLFTGLTANFPVDGDFMKLPIPFASVAGDITTGDEVVTTKGNLPYSMYSSMAIPGVFEPARKGKQVLVDGGVVNNFPVDVAKNMGADIIIGVDLRDAYFDADHINSVGDIMSNLINMYSKGKDKYLSLCDVRIQPDVSGYGTATFTKQACDTLYLRGMDAAKKKVDEIRALKKKYNLHKEAKVSQHYIEQNKWYISQVRFDCDHKYNNEYLTRIIHLPVDVTYNYADIKAAVDRLYGLGSFKYVYFSLEDNDNGKTLVFNIKSQPTMSQNIGLRINTTEMAAILHNLTWKDYTRSVGFVSLSTELSANPGFQAVVETNWLHFPDLGFKYNIKYQDFTVFKDGKRAYKSDLLYTAGKAYLEQRFSGVRMGLSLQEEYFHGNTPDDSKFLFTGTSAYFAVDNLDDYYFPSIGTNTMIDLTTDFDNYDDGTISSYLTLTSENWIPINHKLTLAANLYSRIILTRDYPGIKSTLVGGELYSRYLPYHFPFLGMPPISTTEPYSAIASAGLRFMFMKSNYLTLQFNTLFQGNTNYMFLRNKIVYGGGIKYSLKTLVGPIDVAFGLSNYQKRPSFSANIGLWF
ncbi:MAG: patatin-like phospholipase family protein [Mangrovibacterium sp.]